MRVLNIFVNLKEKCIIYLFSFDSSNSWHIDLSILHAGQSTNSNFDCDRHSPTKGPIRRELDRPISSFSIYIWLCIWPHPLHSLRPRLASSGLLTTVWCLRRRNHRRVCHSSLSIGLSQRMLPCGLPRMQRTRPTRARWSRFGSGRRQIWKNANTTSYISLSSGFLHMFFEKFNYIQIHFF